MAHIAHVKQICCPCPYGINRLLGKSEGTIAIESKLCVQLHASYLLIHVVDQLEKLATSKILCCPPRMGIGSSVAEVKVETSLRRLCLADRMIVEQQVRYD